MALPQIPIDPDDCLYNRAVVKAVNAMRAGSNVELTPGQVLALTKVAQEAWAYLDPDYPEGLPRDPALDLAFAVVFGCTVAEVQGRIERFEAALKAKARG
jgi:hypothetical protein